MSVFIESLIQGRSGVEYEISVGGEVGYYLTRFKEVFEENRFCFDPRFFSASHRNEKSCEEDRDRDVQILVFEGIIQDWNIPNGDFPKYLKRRDYWYAAVYGDQIIAESCDGRSLNEVELINAIDEFFKTGSNIWLKTQHCMGCNLEKH